MSALKKYHSAPRKALLLTVSLGMAALLTAPGVMACKPGKGKCPLPNPAPEGFSLAFLDSANIHIEGLEPGEYEELVCQSEAGATTSSGNYNCNVNGLEVHILTGKFTGDFNKKFWDLCHTFHHVTHGDAGLMTPTYFSYGWLDDCTDGNCAIAVRFAFEGQAVLDETFGEADQLSVEMTGMWQPGGDPLNATNPFVGEDPAVEIDTVYLEFGNTGQKRLAAACNWNVSLERPVWFVSTDTTP